MQAGCDNTNAVQTAAFVLVLHFVLLDTLHHALAGTPAGLEPWKGFSTF